MRVLAALMAAAIVLSSCGQGNVDGRSAALVDVIDGDSLRLRISGAAQEVRLLGLNAPERGECHGPEAANALIELVGNADLAVGSGGGGDTDRFGRLLRYLYADGTLINLALIENGHAVALTVDHDMSGVFKAAVNRAWTSRVGMWAVSACGTPEEAGMRIATIHHDPPGDDSLAPNEEYIAISNDGDTPFALAAWILRDESSSNRYVFEAGTVVAPGASITVHSGCGAATEGHRYWCSGPVWSNGGDSVILQNSSGNVVDASFYDRGD